MRMWWLLFLLLSTSTDATAQKAVVLYRCTDARGVVTLQNDTPCPKGHQQEKRVVEAAATAAPFPVPLPPPPAEIVQMSAASNRPQADQPIPSNAVDTSAPVSPVLPLPAAQKPPGERLPPPPLYQCNTAENDSYLSDTSDPKPRCVRVETVGIDGSRQLGAGQACTMVYDQCQRIPDGAACPAWRKRVNEAQAAWTFARADSAAELKTEYERIARVVAETTCNQ
jgi:hypothetical protein